MKPAFWVPSANVLSVGIYNCSAENRGPRCAPDRSNLDDLGAWNQLFCRSIRLAIIIEAANLFVNLVVNLVLSSIIDDESGAIPRHNCP